MYTLAQNIRKLRKEINISQEKLAQNVGVTLSTLSKVESGINKNPILDTMCKLANYFGVTLDKLTGRK